MEASMVRADLFEQDRRRAGSALRSRTGGTPFGGVQIVLVGDLYQLPPVVTEAEAGFFTDRYRTPYFFSADSFPPRRVPDGGADHGVPPTR